MTFSLKGLKTITNYQYDPACGILSLLDIFIKAICENEFDCESGTMNRSDNLQLVTK